MDLNHGSEQTLFEWKIVRLFDRYNTLNTVTPSISNRVKNWEREKKRTSFVGILHIVYFWKKLEFFSSWDILFEISSKNQLAFSERCKKVIDCWHFELQVVDG